MRRVDITLGLFPNDCTSDSRYSLKGLWQKSWFLQIYLLALGFGFLETLETFGNPWNAPTFRSIFGQAFRHPATRGDRPKPAGGTAWSLSTGHCSSPSTCLEINKRHVFLLQLLDDWINIDSAICMESSDVNCKFCGFFPFFFSLSSAYLTSYGRLHSPACDAAPPWDPDLSWPAWCAAFAWIGCPKSRVKKKQVAKICIDFGQWFWGQIHGFERSTFSGWRSLSTKSLTFVTLAKHLETSGRGTTIKAFTPSKVTSHVSSVSFVDVGLRRICRWNNWQNQVAVDPCECSRGQETVFVCFSHRFQMTGQRFGKNIRPCVDPPCSKHIWWLTWSNVFALIELPMVFLPTGVPFLGRTLFGHGSGIGDRLSYARSPLKSCAMLSAFWGTKHWCDVLFGETCFLFAKKSGTGNILKDRLKTHKLQAVKG